MLKLPIIEIDSRKGVNQDPSVLSLIDAAMSAYGFLGIRDIAFDKTLRELVLQLAEVYFSQESVKKEKDISEQLYVVRGYSGPGADYLSKTQNEMEEKDLVEKFVIGPEKDSAFLETLSAAERELFGHNVWPDIPGFKETYLKYADHMESLASILASLFSRALKLRDDYFVNNISRSPNNIRINHYTYKETQEESSVHLGAHTDFGLFTILLADGRPGLEEW